jgi:hypothetical protein
MSLPLLFAITTIIDQKAASSNWILLI